MAILIKNSQKQLKIRLAPLRELIEYLLVQAGIVTDRDLNILLVNNRTIQQMNRTYFNKDRPTNVISFSYLDDGLNWESLGDMVISVEKAIDEADKGGISPHERLVALVIHGILHIKGFDHLQDPREARRMRYREQKLAASARLHRSFTKLVAESGRV